MLQVFFRTKIYALILPAVFASFLLIGSMPGLIGTAHAQLVRHSAPDDLFHNYYVAPVGPESVGAELYVSPRPTPPMVGHTYITYPPLAPHEFLYKHHRHYRTIHEDAPNTRTSVRWR